MNVPPINQQVAIAAKSNRQRAWPSEFAQAYGAAWITIEEANDVVGRLNKPVLHLDKEEAEVVYLMLFNGLTDIVSAVYTLSSGWIRPSVTALRGATETIATAVVVHHDSQKMARFVDGKLRIPDDILGQAKQFLPSIGRLYGVLTNQWTHETFDSTARSIDTGLGKLKMVPGISFKNMKMYLNVFVQTAVLSQMVGIGLETCFPNFTDNEIYFSIGLNGQRSRKSAPSDDAIRIAVQARDKAS